MSKKRPVQQNLQTLVDEKSATVGIIGLGYVGLPLAIEFAKAGYPVIGFDTDPAKIEKIEKGKGYIKHIPDAAVQELTNRDICSATCDFDRLSEADCIIICVPTPLTKHREPDVSYIEKTAHAIAPRLRKGQLIVLESTTYPGTTREVLQPILEESGLIAGKDFYLAYSPEREDPGNAQFSTGNIPKVVGALTKEGLKVTQALYKSVITATIAVSSPDAAEATKLLENIFRSVNIAMVNELKVVFERMGINIWEVIEAAKSKPFGYMPFYPGPGLGGHCIPIDPFYLTWKAREFETATRFIELAGEVNTSMPRYVIDRLIGALNEMKKSLKGAKILLIGLAYKKGVDDVRESPSFKLIELLHAHGAKVEYHDPFVKQTHKMRSYHYKMKSVPLTGKRLADSDAVLISTDHDEVDYNLIGAHAQLVLDTRNAMAKIGRCKAKVVRA